MHMNIEVLHDELQEAMEEIEKNYQDEDNYTDLEWAEDVKHKLHELSLSFTDFIDQEEKK